MLVSIVIPTFNSGKTLEKTLKSLLKISENIEVIVVDGKSDDKTIEIIKKYEKILKNIIWISENDKGIYDAMNKGIKLANSEWIYFLGSDDYIQSEGFSFVIKNLNTFKEKIVICGVNLLKNGKVVYKHYPIRKINSKTVYLNTRICHQGVIAKKEILEEGFSLKYKLCADVDWLYKNIRKKKLKVKTIREIIANYNLDGASSNYELVRQESFNIECDYFNPIIIKTKYKIKEFIRRRIRG